MRRKRALTAEERALWELVAQRTKPMDPTRPPKAVVAQPKAVPARPMPEADPLPRAWHIGQKSGVGRPHDLSPALPERLSRAPVQMDAKQHGRMKRGKLDPEGRIDLHGMTISEAHPALLSFILMSQAEGRRLVLVITGKGKDRDDGGPIPTRLGILRHQVPQWLNLPPLRQAVLQVTPAHLRHGGQGAYYVYLRRR
jgi:DNA-nicking Smr family endonuclease